MIKFINGIAFKHSIVCIVCTTTISQKFKSLKDGKKKKILIKVLTIVLYCLKMIYMNARGDG